MGPDQKGAEVTADLPASHDHRREIIMLHRLLLETHKARLLKQQARVLQETMREEMDSELDEGDAGVLKRAIHTALVGVLECQLRYIRADLRAMANGTYSICAGCAGPIEVERLQAQPDATLCRC
jgi:RNA polymerase-binding transcription factor DksA